MHSKLLGAKALQGGAAVRWLSWLMGFGHELSRGHHIESLIDSGVLMPCVVLLVGGPWSERIW